MAALAIVIPYYKKAHFAEALDSLARQTDGRFKVYVGNDASPEDPCDILSEFQAKLDITYRYFDKNIGGKSLSAQWHRCLEFVGDEEWVMLLGDDDMLAPECVRRFHEVTQAKHEFSVVRFATQVVNESGSSTSDIVIHPQYERSTAFIMRKLKGETRSSLSEYVYRKSEVLSTKFREYPLAWYSDDMALLEFSRFGTVMSINEATVKVRISSGSITGSDAHYRNKHKAKAHFFSDLIKHIDHFEKKDADFILEMAENVYLRALSETILAKQLAICFVSRFRFRSFFRLLANVIRLVFKRI